MKLVYDLSLTSARMVHATGAQAWDTQWLSPISAQRPALVLDFAGDLYGAAQVQQTLGQLLAFSRASSATSFGSTGQIDTIAPNLVRFHHDPVTFAREGLLLEPAGTNLVLDSLQPVTQAVTVAAAAHVLSFYGTGSVVLSGAASATVNGTAAFPTRSQHGFTPTAGTLTLTISGDVNHLQLETGTTAGSFVLTTTAAVLRAAETATVAPGGWFLDGAGTIIVNGRLRHAVSNDRILEIDNGTTASRLSLLWNSVLGKPQMQVWNGGTLQAAIAPSGSGITLGQDFRLAVSYTQDNFAISMNGSAVTKDTSGAMPPGMTTLRLGRASGGAQSHLIIESLGYYPLALADAEVVALTQ